MALDLDVVAM